MIARSIPNQTSPCIRPLNPARDLGQLADLIEEAFQLELTAGGMQVLREIRMLSRLGPLTYLLDGLGSGAESMFTGFVWEESQQLVGNVTVTRPVGRERRWQLSNVAVRADYRRRGIARALVEAALEYILHRGGESAYLYVRDDNPGALTLYARLGFVEVDRVSELWKQAGMRATRRAADKAAAAPAVLSRLPASRGEALYGLARLAEGPGQRWLYPAQRRQYVLPADERLLRWIESLFTAERAFYWGAMDGQTLCAGAVLRATRLWNRSPHRLQAWVHPQWRGRVEQQLAADLDAILARLAPRRAHVSLPACESTLAAALGDAGFAELRTLILMRLEL
ncbi:MAG: GNAT family N-acetyltransferase [Anaerolineae bacterium]|nr:GNAT family N-acetyltransferase [Anaerolineae bacterium]